MLREVIAGYARFWREAVIDRRDREGLDVSTGREATVHHPLTSLCEFVVEWSESSQIVQASSCILRERASYGNRMALEIERKFLVKHDGWKASVVGCARIRDGLIAILNGRKTRVRILGDRATIAIKGPHAGLTRSEFEYPVPMADAEEMLRVMCDDRILEKVRHYVPHGAMTWEIDVYSGILDGVVIAEVELHRQGDLVELPDWVGTEVTGDVRYSKLHMLRERSGHTFDNA